MLLKRLVSLCAAAVIACGCAACVMADDSKKKEKAIKFKYDESMVVSEKDKIGYTLSFDNSEWKNYVKLTEESEKAGLSIVSETDRAYQGASLKVKAKNTAEIKDIQNVAWVFKDENNKIMFPDVEEGAEGLLTMGIELNAKSFGLSTFDGSMLVLTYSFDEKGVDALVGKSFALFSAKEDNTYAGGVSIVAKNTTISDNINQYRQALVTVPKKANSTKIVIEIPVQKAYTGEIMTIDNIDITLPDDKGYIKNLDGYNENATPKETVEELQVQEQKKQAEDTQITTDKEDSSKSNTVVVVVIVIVGILLLAGGAVLFVKLKAKFY